MTESMDTKDPLIRKYTPEDRVQLVDLWRTVFPDDPPHNAPGKVIDDKLKVDDLIYVVAQKNRIVGACMAGYDGHRGWLYAVAVHPDHRRGSIGSKLVKHTIKELQKIGCGKVNLQIRADNTRVAAFYQSLGFNTENRLSMGLLCQ